MSNPRYDQLVQTIKEIHDNKSHDYAQDANPYSNFEYAALVAERFTDPIDRVFATMMGIKMARLAELTSAGKTPKNEALQDTRRDLANYGMIWASYTEDVHVKAVVHGIVNQSQPVDSSGWMSVDVDFGPLGPADHLCKCGLSKQSEASQNAAQV